MGNGNIEWPKTAENSEVSKVNASEIVSDVKKEPIDKTVGEKLANKVKELKDKEPTTVLLPKKTFIDTKYEYTMPLLNIRGMESGDFNIPKDKSGEIIKAIDNLWDFKTMKIIWYTDASKINTPNAIEKNKNQFNEYRQKYMAAGWTCPTYEELLNLPNNPDPQNTVLWYTRAMGWVLSLNLTPAQIKKIEIGNKLWTKEDEWSERWFDIETNYSKEVERNVVWVIYKKVYDIFQNDLNIEHKFSKYVDPKFIAYQERTGGGWFYYTLGPIENQPIKKDELFTTLIQQLKIQQNNKVVGEKIKVQISDQLDQVLQNFGLKFGEWWSLINEGITHRQYFTIEAVHDKLISEAQFTQLMETGDASVLDNIPLSTWKTIKDFVTEKWIRSVVDNWVKKQYRPDKDHPIEYKDQGKINVISDSDYILLGLYLEIKNDNKIKELTKKN